MLFDNENGVSPLIGRREVLKFGMMAAVTGAGGCLMSAPALAALKMPKADSYRVTIHNAHTNESFSGVYRIGNRYLPDAFERLNVVLRDFRTNEVFPIDPRAIDILFVLQQKIGKNQPLEILSGYRSPKTNSMLRKASGGVAKNSLHMVGQAIDIRAPGYSTRRLRDQAISLKAGGVGYYSRSDFVHVDTGKVRSW